MYQRHCVYIFSFFLFFPSWKHTNNLNLAIPEKRKKSEWKVTYVYFFFLLFFCLPFLLFPFFKSLFTTWKEGGVKLGIIGEIMIVLTTFFFFSFSFKSQMLMILNFILKFFYVWVILMFNLNNLFQNRLQQMS